MSNTPIIVKFVYFGLIYTTLSHTTGIVFSIDFLEQEADELADFYNIIRSFILAVAAIVSCTFLYARRLWVKWSCLVVLTAEAVLLFGNGIYDLWGRFDLILYFIYPTLVFGLPYFILAYKVYSSQTFLAYLSTVKHPID